MKTERTALFLMANLGSEVARLLSALERGDVEMADGAHSRAKKILRDLAALEEMKRRARELALLGEVIDDVSAERRRFAVRGEDIKSYFMPFALRAIAQKGVGGGPPL